MSSVGGKFVTPFVGAYAASKHAMEALSDALRRGLNLYGIDVIVIEPGSIRTPLWDKAEHADASVYAHTDYSHILINFRNALNQTGRRGLKPEVVGRTVLTALQSRRPKSRYPIPARLIQGW